MHSTPGVMKGKVVTKPPPLRPVIGICAALEPARWSFWDEDAVLVADRYAKAVRAGGGIPVALVPEELDELDVRTLVDRIDGLLLIGGTDVDPMTYGASRSPRTEATSPLRDRHELALVWEALEQDVPVLGICRGLQLLNVAFGGTLCQHLADEGYGEHRPVPGCLEEPSEHEIEVEPGSVLATTLGSLRPRVNSHHHQGIARVGKGAHVAARSVPDGVVEALEWPRQRYVLGVQWHPEAMELSTTIAGFVAAAAAETRSLA
jgi:putative glutamine amidotransferase